MKYGVENELRCHDIHTKFHKDWLMRLKVDGGYTRTRKQRGDRISLLEKSRLIKCFFLAASPTPPSKNIYYRGVTWRNTKASRSRERVNYGRESRGPRNQE
jgi:hypothetical protein